MSAPDGNPGDTGEEAASAAQPATDLIETR